MSERENLTEEEKKIYEGVLDAYIFAFPLVMTVVYSRFKTNTVRPTEEQAPFNQFAHYRNLWDENHSGGSNMDTVYSMASLDLKKDALIFHKPETNRFFTTVITDAHGICIAIIGSGGLGGHKAGDYLIAGPDFKGETPEKMMRIDIPTNYASANIRTQIYNQDDLPNVHAIQDGVYLKPLQYNGKDYEQPEGSYFPEYEYNYMTVLKSVPIEEFFSIYNRFSVDNPPREEDREYAKEFRTYHIGAGDEFRISDFSKALSLKLQKIPERVGELLENYGKLREIPVRNGWGFMPFDAAKSGTDYYARAYSIHWGPGCNPAEASVYASTSTDSEGRSLSGAYKYVIHFEKNALPPIREDGYWSISVYTNDNLLYLIKNEIGRYKLGTADEMHFNEDGSLDIFLQHERPAEERIDRWLPIGEGDFRLSLRVYLPEKSVIEGTWKPPFVTRVDDMEAKER